MARNDYLPQQRPKFEFLLARNFRATAEAPRWDVLHAEYRLRGRGIPGVAGVRDGHGADGFGKGHHRDHFFDVVVFLLRVDRRGDCFNECHSRRRPRDSRTGGRAN